MKICLEDQRYIRSRHLHNYSNLHVCWSLRRLIPLCPIPLYNSCSWITKFYLIMALKPTAPHDFSSLLHPCTSKGLRVVDSLWDYVGAQFHLLDINRKFTNSWAKVQERFAFHLIYVLVLWSNNKTKGTLVHKRR